MYDKNYYLAHREEILARAKKWREEHPEQYRKALKKCVKRNGLKYKIQQKMYQCAKGMQVLLSKKQYYLEHKEEILAKVKKYKQDNPEKIKAYNAQLYAKKKYGLIDGWKVFYEIQNTRFHWTAFKDKFKLTDDKESGFPTIHSAYKNAVKYLGDPVLRG
ncbi:MAG: hypothetical protein J6Y17_01890 [Elusimicrobiaceae bacterium]|nr:hypothetical protein [Elusimicrobiaceae bacterium]